MKRLWLLALLPLILGLLPSVSAAYSLTYTSANVNLVISTNTVLTSNIIAGNLTINPGVYLTTNGYSIFIQYTANFIGANIITGTQLGTGGVGASGTGIPGNSFPNSYAGSGGAGNAPGPDGGGSDGTSASAPAMSNALIQTFFTNGFQKYMESGAGGGACNGCSGSNAGRGGNTLATGGSPGTPGTGGGGGSPGYGANSVYGLYLQANKILAGTIVASGSAGYNCEPGENPGGSSGGAAIFLVDGAGAGNYIAGNYQVSGGPEATCAGEGAAGGNGQVATFGYTVAPISISQASSATLSITPNPINYGAGTSTITAACFPSSDNCNIDYPLGTHLASGTGSAAYTTPILAAGSYNYYANDISDSLTSNIILVVNSGSMTYSLNNCTNEAWTYPGSYSCTSTGKFSYPSNQLAAEQQVVGTLNLNSAPVGTTTSSTNTISNTITNTIGKECYTFSTASTANFLSGNAVPICWVGYTPLYTQSPSSTITVNTLGNTITTGYIPYYLYTQSPSPAITYGLNNGIILQSNAANVSYLIGNGFSTGPETFTANEFQPSNPLSTVVNIVQSFTTLNTMLFNSAACTPGLTPASTPIQYFPLQFSALTRNCWNSIPSTYTIDGYTNSSANGIIVTSGSNTLTEPINIRANYNMFSPHYSFNLTSNNGQSLNSVSLIAGCGNSFFEASNSAPAAPCTRVLLNISTYDQRTFGKLNTTTTSVLVGTFNGWTVSNQTSFTGNTYKIYIPTSSFQNPALTLTTTTLSSSATSHFQAINNYCPTTLTSAQSSWLRPYLVDLNGSLYTFNIYQGYSNAGNNDYMWVMDGVNNATAINVQQFRVTGTPFALALENGGLYSFRFYNPNCGIISASNYSIWSNPISLNLPQANNTQSPIKTANVTTSCVKSFLTKNTMAVTCTGTDTQNLVSSWKVTLYNISSISGWTASNTFNESTASFSQTLSPLSNFSPTQVTVVWFGQGFSGSQSFQFNQNVIQSGLSTAARGFIILLFLLVGLGLGVAGASTGAIEQVHAPSTTIFIEALMIALLFFTGLLGNATSPFIPNYIVIGILVLMMFVGIQSHHHESSGN